MFSWKEFYYKLKTFKIHFFVSSEVFYLCVDEIIIWYMVKMKNSCRDKWARSKIAPVLMICAQAHVIFLATSCLSADKNMAEVDWFYTSILDQNRKISCLPMCLCVCVCVQTKVCLFLLLKFFLLLHFTIIVNMFAKRLWWWFTKIKHFGSLLGMWVSCTRTHLHVFCHKRIFVQKNPLWLLLENDPDEGFY